MYDVFISFKNRDDQGNLTEDSRIAEEIYSELRDRNIAVFFSSHELGNHGVGLWREAIDKALQEAQTLVLVGTKREYIYSGQVKYEWKDIFLEEIIDGNKPDGRLIPYLKNIDVKSLEPELKRWTVNDMASKSVAELCDFIEKRLPGRGRPAEHSEEGIRTEFTAAADPTDSGRFHYRAGYTKLIGRNEEIGFLKDFCMNTNYLVSWTVVYGKGGIGKSKLVYEFCNLMEGEGWKAYRPAHAKSFIKEELAGVDRDTVICFDYVKFELDYVEEIIQFAIDRRIRHRLRFLLIERDDMEMEEGLRFKIHEYHYPKGNLKLDTLQEADLLRLIDDYIKNINDKKTMTEIDRKNILDALYAVDPGVNRPLFAMFIADSWNDGNLDLQNWNRESAVRYIADKELDRIHSVASNYAKSAVEKKQYLETLNILTAYATFAGEVTAAELMESVPPYTFITESLVIQMLSDSELLTGDMVHGIEPDLVGEYICIKILNKLESTSVENFFTKLYDRHFTDMIACFDKIYDDYPDILMSADWGRFATNVTIPSTCSYIRRNMFHGCGFIHEVKLHERITMISKGAFRDCGHLRKINFPDNLEIIESAAFLNCSELETAMPDDGKGWVPSIISIEDRAFKNCKKLKEIRLPDSVKEIGREAFAKCEKLEKIEIPREVAKIAGQTFEDCFSLYEIKFKNDAKDGIVIQAGAFKGCGRLRKVINSRRISSIGKSSFEACSGLASISLGRKLTDIAESAFRECRSLEEIDLTNTNIKRISQSVFENCENLKRVILPENLSCIAAKGFCGCSQLREVYLPARIRHIEELAFYRCFHLTLDSLGENVKNVVVFCSFYARNIDEDLVAFVTSYYDEKEVVLPANVYRVGDRAFLSDHRLEKIIFHAGISGIGEEAFRGCVRLREINGSFAGIRSIGQAAFLACRELEQIPEDGEVSVIEDSTFKHCMSLQHIRFNSKIDKIGKWAFSQCTSLKKIYFKGQCGKISTGAFSGCADFMLSKKYHIKRKNGFFYVCGFIFNRLEKEELHFISRYAEQKNIEIPDSCVGFFENPFEKSKIAVSISVPGSIRKLIKNNFANIPTLRSIELPESIQSIPEGTFYGCRSLQTVKIGKNDDNGLKEGLQIGGRAFAECVSLKKISIPGGTLKIENNVFYNCKSLENIDFNEELTTIGSAAFYGCEGLTVISFPESVKEIGYAAFKNCIGLEKAEGLEHTKIRRIKNETFRGCLHLKEILLPQSLKSIGSYAFYDCRKLEKIDVFRTDVEEIGTAAFQNCYMLQEFVLPGKIQKIENFSFKSCTQLKKVKMPSGIEEIGTSAFFGCNMLHDIDLHNKNKLVKIGNDAFAGCHRIEAIILPAGVRKLTRGVFRGCVALRTIEFSGEIKEIPTDCFKDCRQLEKIKVKSEIEAVRAGAFRNCSVLKNISFTENIAVGEAAAFRGCISLKEAVFHQIHMIPAAMFMDCCSLEEIEVPQVDQVDNYAFYGCRELRHVPAEKIRMRIGRGAFWNCCKLEKVIFSETLNEIQHSAFRNCENIKEIRFPPGIRRIYAASFRNAKKLTFVFIPKSAEAIQRSAFRDCISLEEVQIDSGNIMIERMAFAGCENLYYFSFSGTMKAQQTAFESTPVERDYLKDERIEWISAENIK